MKYKLNIPQVKAGFEYSVVDGVLSINGELIEEPTDLSIVEFDIPQTEMDLGITRCIREGDDVVCYLTLFVASLEPYKNYKVKDGQDSNQGSQWDFSELMTAEEVVNGNPKQEVVDAI